MKKNFLSADPNEILMNKKHTIELLDRYAGDILAVKQNCYLVDGAIVSLRFSIELIKAFLITTCADTPRLIRGYEDMNLARNKKNLDTYRNHVFLGIKGESFFATLCTVEKQVKNLIHYQEYRFVNEPGIDDTKRWKAEQLAYSQRVNDFSSALYGEIGYVNDILVPFLTNIVGYELNTEVPANLYSLIRATALLPDQSARQYDWDTKKIEYNNNIRNVCEDYLASIYLCCKDHIRGVLDEGKREDITVYYNTLNLLSRRLAERGGIIAAELYNPDKVNAERQNVNWRAELEDYLQILSQSDTTRQYELSVCKRILAHGQLLNADLHWHNHAKIEQYRFVTGISEQNNNVIISQWLQDIESFVARIYHVIDVPATQPTSVRMILNQTNKEIEALQNEIKTDRRNTCVLLIAIFVVLVLILLFIYLRMWHHPGDPKPSLSDKKNEYVWTELPDVVLSYGGEELIAETANVVTETAANKPASIRISDSHDLSVKWAKDKRFMNLVKNRYAQNAAEVNNQGIALTRVEFIECDEAGKTNQDSKVIEHLVYAGNSDTFRIACQFSPGYYMVSAQAVGAADGLVQNGLELNADTGVISWPIIVVPNDITLVVEDRISNKSIKNSEGLTTYSGYPLSILSDTDLRLVYYYSWDDGNEEKVAEDRIIVTPTSGTHILHIGYALPYMNTETEILGWQEFVINVQEPKEEYSQVLCVFRDDKGNVVANNGTAIVSPDKDVHVTFSAPGGISLVRECYQSGETVATWEKQDNEITISFPNDHVSSPWICTYEVIGKQYSGEEDINNKGTFTFTVLVKTKDDEVDTQGNIMKKWLYSNSNTPDGYILYEYDDKGREIDKSFWNNDDSPAYSDDGYHRMETIHHGNECDCEYWQYDLDGQTLIQGTKALYGCAGVHYVANSEYRSRRFFNTQKEPMQCSEFKNVAGYICYLDNNGNVVSDCSYGVNNELILNNKGYCYYNSAYDEYGNETESWFFGTDGKTLVMTPYGYAHAKYTYGGGILKNRTSEVYYDENDNPITQPGGYVCKRTAYIDGTSTIKGVIFEDESGNAVMNTLLGYSSYKKENGKTKYYDENGWLTNIASGYAVKIEERQDTSIGYKQITEFRNADMLPVIPEGQDWSKCEEIYDRQGRIVEIAYFDSNGNLTETEELANCAFVRYSYYGDDDMLAKRLYYGIDGNLKNLKGVNYCGLSLVSENDNIVYTFFLNNNEQPVENEQGFYLRKTVYDEKGRSIIEERYRQDNTYPLDDQVRRIEWTYEGESEQYYLKREFTQPVSDAICVTEYEYNSKGECIAVAYYDQDNNKVCDEYGVWKWTHTSVYDNDRYYETDEYFDNEGNRSTGWNGFGKVERKYADYQELAEDYPYMEIDIMGECVFDECCGTEYEEKYYDAKGNLCINPDTGYAIYRRSTTANRNQVTLIGVEGEDYSLPEQCTQYCIMDTYNEGELMSTQATYSAGIDINHCTDQEMNIPIDLVVLINEEKIASNADFTKVNSSDTIVITAACDDPLCINWSLNRAHMEAIGTLANDEGMAALAYCIDTVDDNKQILQQGEIVVSADPTYIEAQLVGLPSGYYKIAVLAVGAAEHQCFEGSIFESKTDWIPFFFYIE